MFFDKAYLKGAATPRASPRGDSIFDEECLKRDTAPLRTSLQEHSTFGTPLTLDLVKGRRDIAREKDTPLVLNSL